MTVAEVTMADNGRWFKVWTSILSDPDFQDMTLEDAGRWVHLGALTKLSGERGILTLTVGALARVLRCPPDDVEATMARLPHVTLVVNERAQMCHDHVYGKVTVTATLTWANWRKYQEDPTVAQRMRAMRALRSKKRREEKRVFPPYSPPVPPPADPPLPGGKPTRVPEGNFLSRIGSEGAPPERVSPELLARALPPPPPSSPDPPR